MLVASRKQIGVFVVLAALLASCATSASSDHQAEPGPDTSQTPRTDAEWEATDADSFAPTPLPDAADASAPSDLIPDPGPWTPDPVSLSDAADASAPSDLGPDPGPWTPDPISPPDPCPLLDCDDGNGCTIDWCDPEVGCVHAGADSACNDGDPCTNSDWCIGGVCTGQPSPCSEGMICVKGKCVCEVTCEDKQCGFDSCGSVCGVCDFWQDCTQDQCIDHYPAPPYGPNVAQVMPDHEFLVPADLSSFLMRQYWKQGKLLLMTYNAGWCKVCKEDTVLLNLWHAAYEPAGLRIVSVMYENPSGAPITQEYAKYWQTYYATQYPLVMDQSAADWQGKATGGALNFYYTPIGPIPDGTFPATLLVCPRDMRILYIKAGFYDEEVTPLVMKYLFEVDC